MSHTPRPIIRIGALGALSALTLSLLPALAGAAQAAPTPTAAPGPAAESGVWSKVAARQPQTRDGNARAIDPSRYGAYTLDDAALAAVLDDAPSARAARRGAAPVTVSVPAPNGKLVEFAVAQSPVMEAGLAADHPEIATYAGRAVDGVSGIRIDVSPEGFHASVRGDHAAWFVDPAFRSDDSVYLTYFGQNLPEPQQPLVEPELDEATQRAIADAPSVGEGPDGLVRQRTYRLAFLTDSTYANYVAPGLNDGTQDAASNAAVLAAKVTLMNRVNQIYGDDLGITMVLVDGTDKLNFNTVAKESSPGGACGAVPCFVPNTVPAPGIPTTGSIAGGCTGALLTRNRLVVGQVIGAANFDIGHIGLGINGGGVASFGVGASVKAQGCTGLPTPIGDFYAVDYVAHEMGHQFNAPHTFNGTQVNCSGANRTAAASMEPGSGSSVMAYAGICGSDDLQPHTDPYFSQRSQTDIGNYVGSALAPINEVQSVALSGFDATDSFTLTFGTVTTAPITRGTNYTAAGIKAAVEAAIGGTATVAGYFGGAFNDTGFQITWAGTLAGVDVANPVVNPVGGTFVAQANDITRGGVPTNQGSIVTSANHNPDVTAPEGKFLPVRTPFTLTGSATDSDGDALVYLWEQNDRGAALGTGLVSNTKTNGPLFRIFGTYADVSSTDTLEYNSPGENLADGNPSRTFPDMAQVLAGDTNAETGTCPTSNPTGRLPNGPELSCFSEFLPTADYVGDGAAANAEPSLNFRLTARDLSGADGGFDYADTKLRLDRTAGPFLVTSQDTATSYASGSTQTITWDVNGTDTPRLAPEVRITMSTDGGQTFDRVLATATANDGSAEVTLPRAVTEQGRIKIEAVGNYFFDVNDAPITLTGTFVVDDQVADTVTTQYSDGVDVSFSASSDVAGSDALTATATGLPAGLTVTKTATSDAAARPGTADFAVTGAVTAAPGTYPVSITVSDGVSPAQVVEFTIVVEKETATVAYTGPTTATTPPGSGSASLPLTATVSEGDTTPGDLTLASAVFTDATTGDVLCTDPDVNADGTTGCTATVDRDGATSRTYQVDVDLGGEYYAGGTVTPTALVVTGDSAAPDTTITAGPMDGAILLSETAAFQVASTEDGSSLVCTLDGFDIPCSGPTVTLNGLRHVTHVFTVAAVDADGNVDPTPATRTFTVPLNDRQLTKPAAGFARNTGPSAYLGTYSKAEKKGSELVSPSRSGITSLALVAGRAPDAGAVKVFVGDQLVATVSLEGATRVKQIVPVASFDQGLTGAVRLRTTSGRPVRIEGLAIVTQQQRNR